MRPAAGKTKDSPQSARRPQRKAPAMARVEIFDSCSLTHRVSPGLLSVSSVISAMKIPGPKAPWSAVAAATALTYSAFAYVPYVPKAEGGSCCYRTPRRCARFDLLWRGEGSWESVVKSFFLLIFAFWFFLAPWCLGGEALGAEYHGQVTFGGLAVPGATVTATQGDKQLATTTDPQGLYSFPDLADGKWTIEVRMTGFATIKQDVVIGPNAPAGKWELKLLPLEQMKAEVVGARHGVPVPGPENGAESERPRTRAANAGVKAGATKTETTRTEAPEPRPHRPRRGRFPDQRQSAQWRRFAVRAIFRLWQ